MQSHNDVIAEVTKTCAISNNIPVETIVRMRATADKSTIEATDDLKCFAKCAIDGSGFIVDNKINGERLVQIGVSHGKDEAKLREGVKRCESLFTGTNDCAKSWELYVCFFSDV